MTPRIETLKEKKLVGNRLTMSLANNRTGLLWQTFMPKRREILNSISNDLISMQVYKPKHFEDFKPTNEFEKWATVEVTNFETGIDLIGNATNSVLGVQVTNSTSGFKFVGKSKTLGIGLQIDNVKSAIDIGTGINASVEEGILIGNTNKPIKIVAQNVAGFTSPFSAISLDLNKRQYGIEINESKGAALQFSNAYGDTALLECDIRFSTHATVPVPHMVCHNPPPVTSYSGQLAGAAALQFYNNGSTYQLKFWDGTAWKTVNVS